ncbi:MAG: glycosyl hydrolase [Cyclobacteriaceae bacterium]
MKRSLLSILTITAVSFFISLSAQITTVGSGSYTSTFPGTDEAGRNGFPPGTPQLSGNALGKPVPTNDWWSKLVLENHAGNLFNYPMTMKTINEGLIVTYIPWGVIGDNAPIQVGLSGMNTNQTTISDYTDWTVTMNWNDGSHNMSVTSGIGMPFLYFEKESDDVLEIKVNVGTASVSGEMLIVENASANADFVFYAPAGSSWTQNGTIYTSTLSGKNYWSMAMLPQDNTNVANVANEYKKYAYVFPANTTTEWSYDEATSVVKTDFTIVTDVKEGVNTQMLIGLLPHQWANLAAGSPEPAGYTYESVRGDLKTMEGNTFSVENTFKGILPTMPYLANYSEGFSPSKMASKIDQIENDGLSTWTDSYNEGQVMNRLIQTARIADQTGDIVARDKMVATIKERLEDWLTYEAGEVAFLFYYNTDWSALLGYPAGHGQDNNINDHHFHWGYFIHAAAFMEQFEPGWMNDWGDMVNHLVRDAASESRNDEKFPFLRNFSPYAGHCWANGFASFPQGNDQESTSESMQFNSSLIHWGTITGNDEIRDLGIYLYTTEQTAIEEYWLDIYERNFKPNQQYALVSRVWGNSYDNGTFWTSDITASYGIELYPMHGGSLYLGHNTDYVQRLWSEIEKNTEILSDNSVNPNLWHDTFWKLLSFIDTQKAIDLYDAYPDRILKFGVSDAQTYHWLHAMNALGSLRADITADYPIASAFENNGSMTYVAHNYSNQDITVTYSDGFKLEVAAGKMVTNKDASITGTLTSDFNQAYVGGSVNLSVEVSGDGVSKVEFFDEGKLIGEDAIAPYEIKAENLGLGLRGMYARIYVGDQFNVTNNLAIQVGEQVPFSGTPHTIPGTIEAGHYDKFEGGPGQDVAYVDGSINNEGDYRKDEYVDAAEVDGEGATIGWISSGEWLEYTVEVASAGVYEVSARYASGNANGGGPFYFEIDGKKVSDNISLPSTSTTNWDTWSAKTASLELNKGTHVLRLVFVSGEFNLGKLTFTKTGELGYAPPVADAGGNVVVVLPETTAVLDGSKSADSDSQNLTYFWEQVYGPSIITFANSATVSPSISNLLEGVYKVNLLVSDGVYSSTSSVLVIVSETANRAPNITITSPQNNQDFREGSDIKIITSASDLDGEIAKVAFYAGDQKLGEDLTAPFEYDWINVAVGEYSLTAIATDDAGATATSVVVMVKVSEVNSCVTTSSESTEGSFSVGYTATYESAGSDLLVKFELLDTDKSGVVAYLFQKEPFSESIMDNEGGNVFSKRISGLTPGTKVSYACKFAFAGGLAVTKYIDYEIGGDCSGSGGGGGSEDDTQAPTNFTVNTGAVNASSVEFLLMALDDSQEVIYEIKYNSKSVTTKGGSGVEISEIVGGLSPETSYSFSISAKDASGNVATNSPLTLEVTTSEDTNTACSGTSSEAQQGSFSVGYNYEFRTDGSNVIVTFELLDNKNDVNALLWTESPFSEKAMTGSGNKYTATLTNQTPGTVLSLAVKFAFAGGLAVTKYFSYTVGEDCVVQEPSSDATLSDLKIDGEAMEGFSADILAYTMVLASDVEFIPQVTAEVTHENADILITQATELPGMASVLVTAEDGVTTKSYTITFQQDDALSIDETRNANEPIYRYLDNELSVVFRSSLNIEGYAVYDLSGKIISSSSVNNTMQELTIPIRAKGINIVVITTEEGVLSKKFFF